MTTSPPAPVLAAFRARIEALIAHIRAELADAGNVVLIRPDPGGYTLDGPDSADARATRLRDVHEDLSVTVAGLRTVSAHSNPQGWPAGLPLPLTVRDAVRALEHDAATMAEDLAAEVGRLARDLIDPEIVGAVLARPYIVSRWPWPDQSRASGRALAILLPRMVRPPPGEYTPGIGAPRDYWPGEAAPLDVARWARSGLNRTDARRWTADARAEGLPSRLLGDDLLAFAEAGFGFYGTGTEEDGTRYPGSGIALLFLAERDVREGLRRPIVAVDASKEHHNLLSGWRDMPRDGKRHRGADGEANLNDGRIELIQPGRPAQLLLPYDGGLHAEMIRTLREIRGPKGLRHWTALQSLWSIEGNRRGWVRWHLEDHMAAMGYRPDARRDPRVRREVAEEVEILARLELAIYDGSGTQRHRAPLILVGDRFERLAGAEWRLEGMELRVNDWIYRGVRDPDSGALGRNWMPIPRELAQLDHTRHPYAHALGLILAIRMRWDIGDGRDHTALTGRKLLDAAGIPCDPKHPARAWSRLQREIDALTRIGLLGSVEWEGEPLTFEAVCRLRPAHWLADRTIRRLVAPEAPAADLPRTGAELQAWRTARGWSQRETATRLGLSQGTLSVAEKHAGAELGPKVRRALAALGRGGDR